MEELQGSPLMGTNRIQDEYASAEECYPLAVKCKSIEKNNMHSSIIINFKVGPMFFIATDVE